MANVLYPKGREGILDESIRMKTGDIRVMLIKSDYEFDPLHRNVSDVAQFDNGRSQPLTGKTFDAGVFDADDTWLTVTDSVKCNALVYFHNMMMDAMSRLIAYVDDPVSGLPITPVAFRRVSIEHYDGPNRIFKL